MGITITGFDELERHLEEMQQPEFWAERLDEEYQHIRCPEHGQSPKHTIDAGMSTGTATYCCEKLREMHLAEMGDGEATETTPDASAGADDGAEPPIDPKVEPDEGEAVG